MSGTHHSHHLAIPLPSLYKAWNPSTTNSNKNQTTLPCFHQICNSVSSVEKKPEHQGSTNDGTTPSLQFPIPKIETLTSSPLFFRFFLSCISMSGETHRTYSQGWSTHDATNDATNHSSQIPLPLPLIGIAWNPSNFTAAPFVQCFENCFLQLELMVEMEDHVMRPHVHEAPSIVPIGTNGHRAPPSPPSSSSE